MLRGKDRVMIVEEGEMDGVGKGGGWKQSGNFEWMTKRLSSISFHQEIYIPDLMAISRTACS